MFSIVCETIVPTTTGRFSLARPVWRARLIALAGSPRRAGRVADINTPIMVAEAKSRRFRPECGIADRAMKNHDQARTKSEEAIRARAMSTQERSERTMAWATWSTPIFCAASAVSPSPKSAARPRAALRMNRLRFPAGSAGAGSSEGSLTGGGQRQTVGRGDAEPATDPVGLLFRFRNFDRPFVHIHHLVGDGTPGVAL